MTHSTREMFEHYHNQPFSELPENDLGRNDARRLCFEDFGVPIEIIHHVWRAGCNAASVAPTAEQAEGVRLDPWQPIDTAPQDGKRVLVFEPGNRGGVHAAHFMRYPGRPGQWVNPGCHKLNPTHWMPLPAAPAASTGDQA